MRARILTAAALLSAIPGHAATLRVPSEYATIQAGLDAAAVGDTVLVAPGTYSDYETRLLNDGSTRSACAFLEDGVVLLSESGPSVTTIDMQGATPFAPDVTLARGLPSMGTVIEGFTITGGPVGASGMDATGSGKVTVRGCRFEDLTQGGAGGGIHSGSGTALEVIGTEFVNCVSGLGGAIRANGGVVLLEGCLFQGCSQSAVWFVGISGLPADATVTDCEFIGNADRALGADALWGPLTVSGCWFEGNVDGGTGGGAISAGAKGPILIEGNVFLRNSTTGVNGVGGAVSLLTGTIRGNTFYGNSQVYTGTGGAALGLFKSGSVVQNNLFVMSTGSEALRTINVTVTLGCNIFWQNAEGNCDTCTLTPTDREVFPGFCDASSNDFTVAQNSPALPAYSNGCGQIGAFGQGCGAVSVESRSWGRIKSGYR